MEASDSTDVEYIYPEGSTSPSGINLNGNSVIIKASENDNPSSSPRKINLILDEDKDGVIDDGEKMVEIDETTDLIGGPTIYGYYNESEATKPISITSISGYTPVVFGAYKTSLKTNGETAITMRMLGGDIPGYFYAVNESQVISTGAPAIELYVNTESATSTSQVIGGLNSDIQVSGADKPGIFVEVEKAKTSALYALQDSSYTYKESTGAGVQIDINGAGVGDLYGIDGGIATSDGKETALFDINLKAAVNVLYGSNEATLNAGNKTATAMDMDVTENGAILSSGQGVYGYNGSGSSYVVTGNVDVNYTPDKGTEDNIPWFYAVSKYLKVDGDVNVKLENTRGDGVYAVSDGCYITGNVTLNVPEGNEITGNIYGMYCSKCEGDLIVRAHGLVENTSASNSIFGYSGRYGNTAGETVIGGDFIFDYLGGRCYYLYAGNGSYSSTGFDKIGGKADITVKEGSFYNMYLLQYADVAEDITVTVGDYTTDLSAGNEPASCVVSNSFYPILSCNAANITVKARPTNESKDGKAYSYVVQDTNVTGDLDIQIDGGCYQYLYAAEYCTVGGNADIRLKGVNRALEVSEYRSLRDCYALYYGNITGNINVDVQECNFSGFYVSYYTNCGGKFTSNINNVNVYQTLYGPYVSSSGDIVSNMTDVKAYYVYGVNQNGKIDGSVTINLKNVVQDQSYSNYNYLYALQGSSNYPIEKDVNVTLDNCVFKQCYGVSGATVMGNLKVDIKGGTYGEEGQGTSNYFASVNYVKGTTTIDVSDATYYGNVTPYYSSAGGGGDTKITVENTQFHKGYYDSETISITPGGGQKVTVTLDEDCSVDDTMTFSAGNNYSTSQGEGIIVYDGETYMGGAIRFDEDTTYEKIHFSGGYFHIPEGVTLKASQLYWDSGNLLLDGTLNATVMNEVNDSGVYPNTTVYMAGGTMNVDASKIQYRYWPFSENYKAKGGTVAYYSNYSYKPVTHQLGGNRLFAKAGDTIKYTISVAEGWTLNSVTYTADGVQNQVANSGTTYTFTMLDMPVSFDVDFQGNQIVAGKTVADPVLKLNVATTEEAPAYDLGTLSISNDGLVGEVSYEVDAEYALPEGLTLKGDKIIGTPTVAYENGKKTIIRITGKNDTFVYMVFNFVITTGNGVQTSQEGRITVDDTNKLIYTNGNSVVIGIVENQTAIYIDDNRDGKADFEIPAVTGDYTNYTLYGLRNADSKNPIRITMNDGTIGTICGAQNGDITAEGCGLEIYINGGNVGNACALDKASVSDTMKFMISREAVVTSSAIAKDNTCSYVGYLYQYKLSDGTLSASAGGTYNFTEDLEVDSIVLNKKHLIPEGVTLKAKSLTRIDGAEIRLRGTLLADTVPNNYYGKVFVQGGTLPENCTWDYVYYPVSTTTNIKNTNVTFSTTYNASASLTEDGVKTTYLRAGYPVSATITNAPGYDFYYSVNDAEMKQASGSTFTFTAPREIAQMDVTYIPKQISIQKLFADPIGEVGKEYTAAAPLYDLRGLTLVDDTTSSYGGEVKYALKGTSKLPAGLTLENGRVIGTPTKADMTGTTVSFVITGRNGTNETVDVVIKIAGEDYEQKDINELVKVSGSTIDLQGTSVVILEDPLNTSNSQIYIDDNQDGTADNNNPLLISGATSTNLSNYTICGYTNTSTVYEGDITITVKGGKLSAIYGVKGKGSSQENWAKVNGTVTVKLGDVYMNGTSTAVYGAQWAQVENLNVSVTDGDYWYTEFYGANAARITKNLRFEMGENIYLYNESSTSSYQLKMYAAYEDVQIDGNVNIRLTPNGSGCFSSKATRYSLFYGLYDTAVSGNVVCDVDGYWYTGYWQLLRSSQVSGNVELNLANDAWLQAYNGHVNSAYAYPTVAVTSTIRGDTSVNIAENGTFTLYGLYVFHNTEGGSVTVDVPVTAKKDISNLNLFSNTVSTVTKGTFVNQRGMVTIGGSGEYTIRKDLEAKGITLNETVHVTIAEGVTVKSTSSKLVIASGAKLTNKGTLDTYINVTGSSSGVGGTLINKGVLNTSADLSYRYYYNYYFPILSTGCVINEEGAIWNVAGSVYNLGKIVNYGTFEQTYNGSYREYLGTLYTTEPLTLTWDPATSSYYRSSYITNTSYPQYPDFYYPITVEYPSHCLDGVTISGDAVSASGVEGDTRQYVRAVHPSDSTPTFTVTPGEQLLDTVVLSSVTYGPENALASEQQDGSWLGCAQNIFEPVTVRVNFDAASQETEAITLKKPTDRIENTDGSQLLVYGKYYSINKPLYDLINLEIENDMKEEGQVTYYLDSSSTLPQGMSFKDGKLYGTLMQATTGDQTLTFIVKGKNQTSAFFTLTLGPVAKAVPTFSAPKNLSGLINQTLSNVVLPVNSYGSYSWSDSAVSLGSEVTTLKNQILYFTPTDTDNYDWAKAAANAGLTYTDGKIVCEVDVQVRAGTPTYTAPETITTTYGKTYGEVPIPAGDNDGTFVWYYDADSPVGNIGSYTRWVSYIPNDKNYQTINYIEVTLVVEKAIPTYQKITSLSQECGFTLADIVLPDAEGGKYQWITTPTTVPQNGKTYQIGFKPDDTTNYDWTKVEGWNDPWKCVVFPVTLYVTHTYSKEYAYDETHHWHPCLDETCESVEGKEEHLWDDGFVLVEATMEKEGVIEYSCECGASYEDAIPKLTHPNHIYTGAWKYDADGHWKQCTYNGCVETTEPEDHDFDEGVLVSKPTASAKGVVKYTCEVCKYVENEYLTLDEWENSAWADDDEEDEEEVMEVGDEFEDPGTKAEYEITSKNKEVTYLAPNKKTYSKITVPNTVKFDGITYKVTAIANNAFKSNKKLKTVKIGSNVKTIGTKAFYGCTKLTSVTIGSKVTTIGNSAFQNCTALKSITIPKNVSKIGSKAFYGCKKLTKMTIKTSKLTEKKVGKNAFSKMGSSNYKKTTVKVPKKKLKVYKKMLQKRGLSKKAKVKK